MLKNSYKPSPLRKSYNAEEFLKLEKVTNDILDREDITSPEYSKELKETLIHMFKSIVYRNKGLIYGKYLINEIYSQYCKNEYYQNIVTTYQNTKNINDLTSMLKSFNDINVLPQYNARINKHTNMMNIFITLTHLSQFHNEINMLLRIHYDIQISKFQYLSDIYSYIECDNLAIYTITFTNKKMFDIIIINVMVDLYDIKSYLPLGIYDYLEHYLLYDGNQYILPKHLSSNTFITTDVLINNIQQNIYSLIPNCYNGAYFQNTLDLLFMNKKCKINMILDIDNNISTDYYLTNLECTQACNSCKLDINKMHYYAIVKCCNLAYHIDCLAKLYIDHMPICNTHNTTSINNINKSILMKILE